LTPCGCRRIIGFNPVDDGLLPDSYVREINGVETPISKPDQSERNNLG
jgi:hypothetical protein